MKFNEPKKKKYDNLKTVADKFADIYGEKYAVIMRNNDDDPYRKHGIITIEMYSPVLLSDKNALFAMAELHLNSDICATTAIGNGKNIRYSFSVQDVCIGN